MQVNLGHQHMVGYFSDGWKERGIKEIIEQIEDNRKSDRKAVKD